MRKRDMESVIVDMTKKYNGKYTYLKETYVNTVTKMDISCPEHGVFSVSPRNHLGGIHCPVCKIIDNQKENIEACKKKYNNKYTYSNFRIDRKNFDKFTMDALCPKHGLFSIPIQSHLNEGLECKQCKKEEKVSAYVKKWIDEFNIIHNNKYSYPKSFTSISDLHVVCPEHGLFITTKSKHLKSGCPKCRPDIYNKSNTEEFIEKAIKIHGDKYNYDHVDYINSWIPVKISCSLHGVFSQTPNNHLRGLGCNQCSIKVSKPEHQIVDIFSKKNPQQSVKQIISPYEIDIFFPKHNIAIEYNGLMWHSFGKSKHSMFNNFEKEDKNKHLNKTQMCEEKNIQLFHIFENEWLNKQDIWESVLNNSLNNSSKIYARKCTVREIPSSSEFENNNHLQGMGRSSVKLGLFFNEELVSLMTFGKPRFNKKYEWEIVRFCSKLNTVVIGGASKLLKYFERNYKPESIISYANRRWSQGKLYKKLGFDYLYDTKPNYFYFLPNVLDLKSRNVYQKHKLKHILKNFDPSLSEKDNMFNNNYRRIWDCGNKVYVKKIH